jgi:hypothetical protein
MTVLYLMATAISVVRYMLLALRHFGYQQQLLAAGLTPFRQSAPLGIAMVLVPALLVLGTIAAAYFLLSRRALRDHEVPQGPPIG